MTSSDDDESAAQRIERRIAELGDWRADVLSRVRDHVRLAVPGVVEDLKWAKASNPGVPTWSHHGIICTGEPYRSVVKLTFAKGAALHDPAGLFNAGLDGNVRRAIDLREGDEIDGVAFRALVAEAAAHNEATEPTSRRRRTTGVT